MSSKEGISGACGRTIGAAKGGGKMGGGKEEREEGSRRVKKEKLNSNGRRARGRMGVVKAEFIKGDIPRYPHLTATGS